MKKILFGLFKYLSNLFAGSGIGSFPLVAAFYHFIFPKLKPEWVTIEGEKLYLDPKDSLALSLFGVYEKSELELIKREVKEGMTVLDIGANIGYFTLVMAKLVSEKGKIYAFEPDPGHFKILQKNIKTNGYKNIYPIKKALSNKNQKDKLYLNPRNLADHSLHPSDERKSYITIDSIRLDSFFQNKDKRVDFIKIDIEGGEEKAILGMDLILKKNTRLKMIMEFWPEGLRKGNTDPIDLLRLLTEKYDFSFYYIGDDRYKDKKLSIPQIMKIAEKNTYINLFCRRN